MWELVVGGEIISILKKPGLDLAFTTLNTLTSATLSSLKYLTTCDQPSVKEVCEKLDKMDLEALIKFVQCVNTDLEEGNYKMTNSVKIALAQVIETTGHVNQELDELKHRIEYHKSKYFMNWRTFYCEDLLVKLSNHKLKLDDRLDRLFKVLPK